MLSKFLRLVRSDDGPTAVEYAVMLALIVVVCLTSVKQIGKKSKNTYQKAAASLHSAS